MPSYYTLYLISYKAFMCFSLIAHYGLYRLYIRPIIQEQGFGHRNLLCSKHGCRSSFLHRNSSGVPGRLEYNTSVCFSQYKKGNSSPQRTPPIAAFGDKLRTQRNKGNRQNLHTFFVCPLSYFLRPQRSLRWAELLLNSFYQNSILTCVIGSNQ